MKRRILGMGLLLAVASTAVASSIGPMDFNFIAPAAPTEGDVPNQVGSIFYDTTEGVFKGRSSSSWQVLTSVGANTSLSNLTSPTAVNQHLLPSSDGAVDLGAANNGFGSLYVKNQIFSSEFPGTRFYFYPGDGSLEISAANYINFTANGPKTNIYNTNPSGGEVFISTNPSGVGYPNPAPGVNTGVATVTTGEAYGSGNSGNLELSTGNSAANSGNVNITTGTASGTRGVVNINALAVQMPTGTTDPTASAGAVYYNTSTNKLRLYDGSSWVDLN